MSPREATLEPGLYELRGGRLASGKMQVEGPGRFVIQVGSEARADTTPTCPAGTARRRAQMLTDGILLAQGSRLVLQADYAVTSSSMAASILLGRSANGNDAWKRVADSPDESADTSSRTNIGTTSTLELEAINPTAVDMNSFINSTVTTFERERHRYADLVELVRGEMGRLTQGMAVAIQYRVKDSSSLKNKLLKYWNSKDDAPEPSGLREQLLNVSRTWAANKYGSASESDDWYRQSPQERTLDGIPDLAGLRILFYREADMENLLARILGSDKQAPAFKNVSDAADDDPDSLYIDEVIPLEKLHKQTEGGYQAHHIRLVYLGGTNDSKLALDGARCEVQITTVASHLLNEVSHEVEYNRLAQLPLEDSGAIKLGIRNLHGLMKTLQEQIDDLFDIAKIPSVASLDTEESAASPILNELWSDAKLTRAEQLRSDDVRKWLSILAEYAAAGSDDDSQRAHDLLRSRKRLTNEWKSLGLDEVSVANSYASLYDIGGREDPRGKRQLDPQRSSDAWLIKILSSLPTGFLRSFADDKGSRTTRVGRPPLIVDIADAFLEAKQQGF